MVSKQPIAWKRVFVEATAIVASILIAFSIDAWWQNRTERIIEVQYLEALRDDLVRSLELLDESEAFQSLQLEYLESLLLTDNETPYTEELRRWIDDGLWNIGTYQPQLSALDDLESSGQAQIIENQEIRRALASVKQRVDTVDIARRDFMVSQQMLIDTYLVDNLNLSDVMLDREGNPETDLSALGTDAFQSRVSFKISLRREVRNRQDEVRAAFVEALALIESELAARTAK